MEAIATNLVTTNLLSQRIQRLYYPQPKLLPLLILGNGDIFDVTDETEVMYTAITTVSRMLSSHP